MQEPTKEDLLDVIRFEARLLHGTAVEVSVWAEDVSGTTIEGPLYRAGARAPDCSWAENRTSSGKGATEIKALQALAAAFRVPLLAAGYVPPVRIPTGQELETMVPLGGPPMVKVRVVYAAACAEMARMLTRAPTPTQGDSAL